MAVNKFCPQCKTSYKLSKRKCQKCDKKLTQFRVRVKNLDDRMVTRVCHSLSEANQTVTKLENSHSHYSMSLDEAYFNYIDYASTKKASWKDDQQRYVQYVGPVIGSKQMSRIRPLEIQQIINGMHSRAPATRRQVLQLISRIFNWSTRFQLYKGLNPCTAIEREKLNNERIRYLSQDETNRLLKVLDVWENERASLVIRFLLFSGKRKGEILNLRWQDVDLGNGYITLPKPKGGRSQTIPTNETCLEILNQAFNIRISNLVFPSNNGNHYGYSLHGAWSAIRKRAKLEDFRMHDLRHTWASQLASSGEVDIYTLSELMGHSSVSVTKKYAHLFPTTLRKATEVADRAIQIREEEGQQ